MSSTPVTYPRLRNSGSSVNLPLARTVVIGANLTLTDNGSGQGTIDATNQTTAPGGSSGQLQYNSSSAFAGAAFSAVATSGTLLTLTAGAITDVPLAVKAFSGSQSARLFEARNSSGTPLGGITATGALWSAGTYDETTTTPGFYAAIQNTPRCMFANGTAAQNWQIDNNSGVFRWLLPGSPKLALDTNGPMADRMRLGDTSTTANTLIRLEAATQNAAVIGIRIQGETSQSADLLQLWGKSDTPTNRQQGAITSTWGTSADATRKARILHYAYDTAARECLRLEASGTAPMLGFYGSAATAQQTVTGSRGANAALASLLTALATLGLIVDGSS